VVQKGHELLCDSLGDIIRYLGIVILVVVRASAHHALCLVQKSHHSAIWVRTLIHVNAMLQVLHLDASELGLHIYYGRTLL